VKNKLTEVVLASAHQIEDGEKYALVALSQLPFDFRDLPDGMEVGTGLWIAPRLPFTLEQHWREWIGSVRTEHLMQAQLILVSKNPSTAPGNFDGENERLMRLVDRFYQGLQLASPLWVTGDVVRLTGAKRAGVVDVRQMSNLTPPGSIHYGKIDPFGVEALRLAAVFAPILDGLLPGKYLRLCRVLNAYFSGVAENDVRERLHQFCRCVEGLILAKAGQTTRQFKSRTELFIGPSHQDVMGSLYENRSAVEHMNDPVVVASSDRGRYSAVLELALIAEAIARHCLSNILLKPDVLDQYVDEESLGEFWSHNETHRRSLWGPPLDFPQLLKQIRKRRGT
jgi:hypothetical protein